ncbi:MAG: dehypoxanthine futalosine cyclase, partial [Deltaproteobacteria bacterium]
MRMTTDQALDMLRSDDLIGIGQEADCVRARLHPGGVVTYQIDRNINYTNVCTEYCSFCAFYRPVGSAEGYVQPLESIFQKIDETLALG